MRVGPRRRGFQSFLTMLCSRAVQVASLHEHCLLLSFGPPDYRGDQRNQFVTIGITKATRLTTQIELREQLVHINHTLYVRRTIQVLLVALTVVGPSSCRTGVTESCPNGATTSRLASHQLLRSY